MDTLSQRQTDRMFNLMSAYFDNVCKDKFEKDLNEKHWVIILKDSAGGEIQGFSTFMLLDSAADNTPVKGIFSGDTIVDKKYWGETELMRVWGKFIISLMEKYKDYKLYWFLSSMGYKTYKFLPVYLNEFYPRYDKKTPPFEQKVLDAFAYKKYPLEYNGDTGIIHFDRKKECLKTGMADIAPNRLKNPHIKFFAEKNPLFWQGDELACIAELSEENMKPAMKRTIFGRGA